MTVMQQRRAGDLGFYSLQFQVERRQCDRLAALKFENRILRRLVEIHWAVGLIHKLKAHCQGDKWANRNRSGASAERRHNSSSHPA